MFSHHSTQKGRTNTSLPQKGEAAIITVILLSAIMTAIASGFSSLALRHERLSRIASYGTQSYFTGESGLEDAAYRIMTARALSSQEVLSLGDAVATTTIVDVGADKVITATSSLSTHTRFSRARLSYDDAVQFHYGMQSGEGGILLENTATVAGNIYSNGSVLGSNNNLIQGEVVSAGPAGLIDGVHSTSTAYAHTITGSVIEGDAHYQSISGTTVLGTSYPGSTDQATTSLPIDDAMIADWESEAEDGGTITTPCPYVITEDIILGPAKIDCDLEISGSPTVTLAGNVFVAGDIDMKNTATIRVDASLGSRVVVMIADNASDQLASSKINLSNSVVFQGSGSSGSYIMLVSQNKSAESGGSEKAIDITNSIEGALLVYAGHGEIQLQNNVDLKEVTAYRIRLKNSAEVIYESGLSSLLFSSGPGGGYNIGSWREVE